MELLLRMLPRRRQPLLVRYGATAVLVGLCMLILIGLRGLGGLPGFYLLFPAIFAASILFDRSSGILATVLSGIALYFVLRPDGSLQHPGLFLQLLAFMIIGLALALISEGLRTAWERAVGAERAKDLLLHELGHRTKNNLAMVISMLSLQARSKTNPEVRLALEKAVARIQAIASAHDHFDPRSHNGRIEMRLYLEELCNHLADTLREVRPIAVKVDADDVNLRTEQAVPLGLIVNELVTNAFKHAFPEDRSGRVSVVLRARSPLTLIVEDNGIGCPADRQERLGSRLTRLLAEQLGGRLVTEDAAPGCRVRLELSTA